MFATHASCSASCHDDTDGTVKADSDACVSTLLAVHPSTPGKAAALALPPCAANGMLRMQTLRKRLPSQTTA